MCEAINSFMLATLRLDNMSSNDHFKILRTLGSGAFGSVDNVYLCHENITYKETK